MTRIIIVDDRADNLYLLRVLLEAHGYSVTEARHGVEALAKAHAECPDLIISDLLMPGMDGYTLLRTWKQDEQFKSIPFIVYTATYTDAQDEKLALDLGADAFILKPAEPEALMTRVRALLEQKRAGVMHRQRPSAGESAQLREYSEVLIRKLEEKAGQLEQTNRALAEDIVARQRAETALRTIQERQARILETVPDGIVIVDTAGRMTYANSAAGEILGLRRAAPTGPPPGEPPSQIPGFDSGPFVPGDPLFTGMMAGAVPGCQVEHALERPNGTRILLSIDAAPLHDAAGRIDGIVAAIADITKRRRAEAAIRDSEARLAAAQARAKIGSWEIDLATGASRWSAEMFRLFDRDAGREPPGTAEWLAGVHPDDRRSFEESFRRAIAGGTGHNQDFRVIRRDGSVVCLEGRSEMILDRAGHPLRLVGTAQDVTERKQARDELMHTNERLRALAARVQAVREEERTGIAREIHDVLAQELTRLKIDLVWLARRVNQPIPEVRRPQIAERLADAIAQADVAITTVQRIATELRPVILDSLGLPAAIEWLAGDFARRTRIKCAADVPGGDAALDRDRATALFRILQESLTNIARHAQATAVRIALAEDAAAVTLTVSDNGTGITPEQLNAPRSIGLTGMRERAQAFGGTVVIEGAPGRGTTVRVWIPRDANAAGSSS